MLCAVMYVHLTVPPEVLYKFRGWTNQYCSGLVSAEHVPMLRAAFRDRCD